MSDPDDRRTPFADHFSGAAAEYAAFRPRYPAALFAALADLAPALDVAWDCATGSGQAAVGLAAHFARVMATDASAAQIASAAQHPRVTYHVATAEASALAPRSVQLVTVAQALHWFDQAAFHAEVRRVLVPGGVVAAWGYALFELDPAVDALVHRFSEHTLADYWPPERVYIDAEYRSLPFPFDELPFPAVAIEQPLTLDGLSVYLRTWSAVLRYRQARGHDPVEPFATELREWWGDASRPRMVRWRVFGRVGVV